jgi:hypothetical protein
MNTRLRLSIILFGALLVALTWSFPLWQPLLEREAEDPGFPGLAADLQDDYLLLSAAEQRLYTQLAGENAAVAIDLLTARLQPDMVAMPEALREVSVAVIQAQGGFIMLDQDTLLDEYELDFDLVDESLSPFQPLSVAQGAVTFYVLPDLTQFLRLTEFRVTNGPGLRVYLSTERFPLTAEQIGRDYIDLGPLAANAGDQDYAVPTEVDLRLYQSVVIFSATYQIIYGVAPFVQR